MSDPGGLRQLRHPARHTALPRERGWVRRERSPEDGRGSIARLTDQGWDVVVDTAPGHVAAVRRYVFDALSREQVRQLEDIAGAVLGTLDPDGSLRPPVPEPFG